jgi:hypothetical protein
MKPLPKTIGQYLAVFSAFSATALVFFAAAGSGQMLHSTPYAAIDATADAKLSSLTAGQGAGILDGVVAKVRARATEKGGNPVNPSLYTAYVDGYLAKVDRLDNDMRTAYGNEYAFLFQYIYPRVYAIRTPAAGATAGTVDYVTINIASNSPSVSGNGTGNHIYIPSGLSATQKVTISDPLGDNAFTVNFSEISFGTKASTVIQFTYTNGAVINVLGAHVFKYDIGNGQLVSFADLTANTGISWKTNCASGTAWDTATNACKTNTGITVAAATVADCTNKETSWNCDPTSQVNPKACIKNRDTTNALRLVGTS